MSPIDERLKSLNIVLPEVMPPVVDGYVPAFAKFIRSGDQIHLSGRLGKEGGKLLCGKVDAEISVDQAKLAARHVAIELLAVLKAAIGDSWQRSKNCGALCHGQRCTALHGASPNCKSAEPSQSDFSSFSAPGLRLSLRKADPSFGPQNRATRA